MKDYQYHLERYNGRGSRHICPNCGRNHCFVFYVDNAGNILDESVGRCDHASSCGYHYTPREYFSNNGEVKRESFKAPVKRREQPKPIDTIPMDLILQSEHYDNNPLFKYLYSLTTDKQEIIEAFKKYHIGTTTDGRCIFPQIDIHGKCRSGKCMAYGEDGHRIKTEGGDKVDWLHTRYIRQKGTFAYDLKQTFFGEHLLKENPNTVVCLVEAEKTAVIMSLIFPEHVWLASGGLNGINDEKCEVLRGRTVVLFPDADCQLYWDVKPHLHSNTKTDELMPSKGQIVAKYAARTIVSDWMINEPLDSHRDIADIYLDNIIKQQTA